MTSKATKQKTEDRGLKGGDREPKVENVPDRSSIVDSQNSNLQDERCPSCSSPRTQAQEFCEHCGLIYASFAPPTLIAPAQRLDPSRLHGRYQLGELISSRGNVSRYRGLDFGGTGPEPTSVIILKGPSGGDSLATLANKVASSEESSKDEEVLPSFEDRMATSATETIILPLQPPWPSVAWEQFFLEKVQHSALPRILDHFTKEDCDYLVVESRTGRPFWDAWDDPSATAEQRLQYPLCGHSWHSPSRSRTRTARSRSSSAPPAHSSVSGRRSTLPTASG